MNQNEMLPETQNTPVSLKKYLLIFCGIYTALLVVCGIVGFVFDIDLGSATNIIVLFSSGYGAAIKFITDHQRAPSKIEKRALTLNCLAASILIPVLYLAALLPFILGSTWQEDTLMFIDMLPLWIWLIILAITTLISYCILNLVFGWASKKYAAKLVKAEMSSD